MDPNLALILGFGTLALLILGVVQASRFRFVKGAIFSPEFATSFGLIVVATVLGALALRNAVPTVGITGATLAFGAFALIVLGVVQASRFKQVKGARFSPEFATSYGLILVATLGGALALSGASSETTTGAFTLFGIIAGYIAGTKAKDPVTPPPGGPDKPPPPGGSGGNPPDGGPDGGPPPPGGAGGNPDGPDVTPPAVDPSETPPAGEDPGEAPLETIENLALEREDRKQLPEPGSDE